MVQSHHLPSTDLARLIIILAGSTLTPSSQTSPRVHVPGHAVLCLCQETCCWASPRASASGRTAPSTQELLADTSLQKLPPSSLLLCRSVCWSSVITEWGHVFTHAYMCMYFSLLPFLNVKRWWAFVPVLVYLPCVSKLTFFFMILSVPSHEKWISTAASVEGSSGGLKLLLSIVIKIRKQENLIGIRFLLKFVLILLFLVMVLKEGNDFSTWNYVFFLNLVCVIFLLMFHQQSGAR